MADIFISYASEDRDRAQSVAEALGAGRWSVWWDRQIPLGKSFDEVIEQQIAAAKCVIVLWSAVSVAKEWVRNETAEGKRRGILLPVFIEPVNAPLQFRSLNGADLTDWQGESSHPEFQRLSARVAELIGNPTASSAETLSPADYQSTPPRKNLANRLRSPATLAGAVMVVIGLASAAYFFKNGSGHDDRPDNPPREVTDTAKDSAPPPRGTSDMEKAIKDMAGAFKGAIPATSLAKAFHVPGLGLRVAYISPEQSAATLGSMPSGAVVMEVESGRPVAKAGVHVGDVILTIAGKKVASENDLRQAIFKIGPGKTEYSYRRGGESKMVSIDCPSCIAE